VPASLLATIPLLNRVGHVFTDFSYLLIIHLTIQSAYGFRCLAKVEKFRQMAGAAACVVGIFAGMILLYSRGYAHQPIPWDYFLWAGAGAIGAPLLFVFLRSRQRQTFTLGWVGIIILGFIPNLRFGLYHLGNDALLLLPGPRVTLNTPSKAIDRIKTDKSEPFRVVGLQWSLMGDYPAVYELEDIRSCAPLSNGEFMDLIRSFPGVELSRYWIIEVADPVRAQPLLNLLNVKYLLAPTNVSIHGQLDFRLVGRSDFGILENLQVWPRAFFANQVVAITSNEKFIQQLLKNGQHPFIALTREEIEKRPGLQQLETTNQTTISPATNYRLFPNSTEFDIHAPSPGVVCLTEGQAKDFTAKANNESKEVLTVNRAFKGIYLDQPGDYHITFSYRPRHWRLACTLFWISAGVVIALVAMAGIRARVQQKAGPAPDRNNELHEPSIERKTIRQSLSCL
jgi:multidrug transporter EmrE-like cation transporter